MDTVFLAVLLLSVLSALIVPLILIAFTLRRIADSLGDIHRDLRDLNRHQSSIARYTGGMSS